jgi:hypothetical protein
MSALSEARQLYFPVFTALFLSGCGTVYLDEADRDLGAAEREIITVERSVDGAYREIYGRLQDCVSVYGYRVRGDINRERSAAEITVDSGVGFDRVLYLAEALFLKAELEHLAPERARVTFILSNPNARPFADALKRWLVSGDGPCRA